MYGCEDFALVLRHVCRNRGWEQDGERTNFKESHRLPPVFLPEPESCRTGTVYRYEALMHVDSQLQWGWRTTSKPRRHLAAWTTS